MSLIVAIIITIIILRSRIRRENQIAYFEYSYVVSGTRSHFHQWHRTLTSVQNTKINPFFLGLLGGRTSRQQCIISTHLIKKRVTETSLHMSWIFPSLRKYSLYIIACFLILLSFKLDFLPWILKLLPLKKSKNSCDFSNLPFSSFWDSYTHCILRISNQMILKNLMWKKCQECQHRKAYVTLKNRNLYLDI